MLIPHGSSEQFFGESEMTIEGAVIKEQGVTFAVVIVKEHVLNSPSEADRAIQAFQPIFPGLPVILMAQDYRGVPTYHGRRDISKFMASVPMSRVPWKRYTVS
jgi:hypothetical protein